MNKNITETLTDIGFTQNEARTYQALLELGEAQTGILCDRLKIPSSHIYRILKSLLEKGVIGYKIINNIKVFKPNDPKTLNVLYLKKQEELEKQRKQTQYSIKHLKRLPLKKETCSDYKYFEGISGIKALWLEIDELMVPHSQAVSFISIEEAFKGLNAFYLEHHRVRVKKKVFLRMIMPTETKKYAKERENIGYFEARYLDLDNEGEFEVHGDYLVLQYTSTKTPRGFLIKDPVFAITFRNIFDYLWKIAKP